MKQSKNQLSIFSTLNKQQGYKCPCCNQLVKVYVRSFNCNMALCLIALVRYEQLEWIKIEDFLLKHGYQRCGDFSYLRYYNMLEKMERERQDGSNRNGFYRITQKGIDFAKGLIKVPEHFLTFNNQCEGFEGELIDVRKALGKKFSYEELMQNSKAL